MTVDVAKNMGASVRQRLLNYAKANGRPFAEVLQHYAMERFLYLLSISPQVEAFTLKGALLLTAWQAPISRPTMDTDLLGRTDNAVDALVALVALMREISQVESQTMGSFSIRRRLLAKSFGRMPTMRASHDICRAC